MNIFEALRESHDRQRELVDLVVATSGDSPERRDRFVELKRELEAHALAEERHFYVHLIEREGGVDLSRHAIAEHHEIDVLIAKVTDTDYDSPAWLVHAKSLGEKIRHHLQEEEQKFFQMAGKVLDDSQKISLAEAYRDTYREARRD